MLRRTLIYSHILCLLAFQPYSTFAQTHHALTGSRFAGSLGMYQQPASTLSSVDTIDFALLSPQFSNYTNFIDFGYAPLFKKNPEINLQPTPGDMERDLITNINMQLFGFKYKPTTKLAVGLGMNLRSMFNLHTSHYIMSDSVTDIIQLFQQNKKSLPFKGNGLASGWIEYVANTSYNLVDNRSFILNIGTNLRMNRGLVGLVGAVDSLEYENYTYYGVDIFKITNEKFLYGYSTTISTWDNTLTFKENVNRMMKKVKTGASLDIGTEILIKKDKDSDWFYEGLDYNYSWKLGLSVTDLGFTKYEYYPESATTAGMKPNMTPEVLVDKLLGLTSDIRSINDTIATIVERFQKLNGNFKLFLPSRFNINIDHKITPQLFLNADASFVANLHKNKSEYVFKDISYVTLTPRYEKRRFGLYVPVSFNSKTKWNIGAALRMGPLIVGVQRLNTFNNSNDLQNTSAYFSLLIRWKKRVPKPNYDFIKSPRNVL